MDIDIQTAEGGIGGGGLKQQFAAVNQVDQLNSYFPKRL